jgi:hypothetical protein
MQSQRKKEMPNGSRRSTCFVSTSYLYKITKKIYCNDFGILLGSLEIAPRGAGTNRICPENADSETRTIKPNNIGGTR